MTTAGRSGQQHDATSLLQHFWKHALTHPKPDGPTRLPRMVAALQGLEVTSHTLRSFDGAALAVWRVRRPSFVGQPLVWGHANGFSSACYPELLRSLADCFAIWTWDARGHGASGLPPGVPVDEAVALDALGADARLVCEHAAAEAGHLPHAAAHSFGGSALLRAAMSGPLPWRTATLFEPPLVTPQQASSESARAANNALADATLARRRHWAAPEALAARLRGHPAYALLSDAALAAHALGILRPDGMRGWVLRCAPEVEAAIYRSVFDQDVLAHVSSLRGRVQFVASDGAAGGMDRPSRAVQSVAAGLVGVPVIELERSSHFLALERPRACADIIRRTALQLA